MWRNSSFQYVSFLVSAFFSISFSFKDVIHLKQRSRDTSTLLRSNANDKTTFDLEKFKVEQFQIFRKNQIGKWTGVHTGYDPENADVADYMYLETQLEELPVETNEREVQIKHKTFFVMGEIRTDCEVCFDSERVKEKDMGIYKVGNLKGYRSCANVDLKGPLPTPRGMSMEFTIRNKDEDNRIRVLIAYAPLAWNDVGGLGQMPSSMKLRDIVIVRERIGSRPLMLDKNPDIMWFQSPLNLFDSEFEGTRQRNTVSGSPDAQSLGPSLLEPLMVSRLVKPDIHTFTDNGLQLDNIEGAFYRRSFPGGILVETPWVIESAVEVQTRVAWQPGAGRDDNSNGSMYSCVISFSALALDEEFLSRGELRMLQPTLRDFFVDNLKIVTGK